MYAGNAINDMLDKVDGGKGKNAAKVKEAKQQALLNRLLFPRSKAAKKQFRDPALRFGKGGD